MKKKSIKAFDSEKVKQKLKDIEKGPDISYETLMKNHRRMWSWAMQKLKEEDVQERLKKIKKRALKVSVRAISKGKPLNHHYLDSNYGYLVAAAKRVYDRDDEKCFLQVFLEESDVKYFKKNKYRNLRQVLEDIAKVGSKPEDFTTEYFYETNSGLGKVVKNRFGSIGKGVILVGVDYLQKNNSLIKTRKHKYCFTTKELLEITKNKSLKDNEKGACLFNVLSLQFYDFSQFKLEPYREIDNMIKKRKVKERVYREALTPAFKQVVEEIEKPVWFEGNNYDVLETEFYQKYGINLSLAHKSMERAIDGKKPIFFRIRLCLDNQISNPIHDTRFYFQGNKISESEDGLINNVNCPGGETRLNVREFYMSLNKILKDVR